MRIPRGPLRLAPVLAAAAATAAGALALATAPDITPPPGLLYRTVFIDRSGAVQDTNLEPPPDIDVRPLFISRDGAVLQPSLDPPQGIDQRPLFIDRYGNVQVISLQPPPGLLNPGPFIQRDGSLAAGSDTIPPPPGLDSRAPFIGRDGDFADTSTDAPPAAAKAGRLELRGLYPNPFNPGVEISFQLHSAGPVRVTVVDVRGRLVRVLHDGPLAADLHVLRWDGRDGSGRAVAGGSYLFRVQAGDQEVAARGALVK